MKLRNKKTGEIITNIDVSQYHESIWILQNEPRIYRSLAELNAEWEDYAPQEPLINDEKIRKVVRMWADLNEFSEVKYNRDKDCLCSPYDIDCHEIVYISFDSCNVFKELCHLKLYDITELCGEEE